MSKKNSLESRMKENYENRAKTYLPRRSNVILRIDGRSFHNYTKGFKKPYDEILHEAMNQTMLHLCQNIQGCKLGYAQSDEISLLLCDYDTITTSAWFDYSVEKICSIAASMTTVRFNKIIDNLITEYCKKLEKQEIITEEDIAYQKALLKIQKRDAMFDCRCFLMPDDEVANCFIWRQQDATRNAIQMLGQCYFTHSELHKKTTNDIQDMLMLQKGINFNDMLVAFKRGVCCKQETYLYDKKLRKEIVNETFTDLDDMLDYTENAVERTRWKIDMNIPIFTKDRAYIEGCMPSRN